MAAKVLAKQLACSGCSAQDVPLVHLTNMRLCRQCHAQLLADVQKVGDGWLRGDCQVGAADDPVSQAARRRCLSGSARHWPTTWHAGWVTHCISRPWKGECTSLPGIG